MASCQNYAHPLPPPKKKTNKPTSFFCLAGPCQKMFGNDGWMFGYADMSFMSFLRVQAFYATFEGNRSVTVGFGLDSRAKNCQREKRVEKSWNFGFFFECCWGNLLLRAILRNFAGIFRVGLIQRWQTPHQVADRKLRFFGPKPAGLEQFSNKKEEPANRRRAEEPSGPMWCPGITRKKTRNRISSWFLKYRFWGPWWTKWNTNRHSIDQLLKGYEDQLSSIWVVELELDMFFQPQAWTSDGFKDKMWKFIRSRFRDHPLVRQLLDSFFKISFRFSGIRRCNKINELKLESGPFFNGRVADVTNKNTSQTNNIRFQRNCKTNQHNGCCWNNFHMFDV